MKKFIILISIICLFNFAVEGEDGIDNLEGLSPEDMARIDQEEDTWIPENEVILPNGQNLKDYNEKRGIKASSLDDLPKKLDEK